MPESEDDVLVVGGTGYLGGKVVDRLLAKGKRVRALVRPGTDTSALESKGARVVRGDLTDRKSLDKAIAGVSALITTAQGYNRRRKGDSVETVDHQGNLNLIDAALANGEPVFVFTSIVQCQLAGYVPHFHTKYVIEEALKESGLSFVSLRAGGFFDNFLTVPMMRQSLERGRLMTMGRTDVPMSYVLADEVARCLAASPFESRACNRIIDLASDRPLTQKELKGVMEKILERPISLRSFPYPLMALIMRIGSLFNPFLGDMLSMIRFFQTGKYIADTSLQSEIFGPPLSVEESLKKAFSEVGMV